MIEDATTLDDLALEIARQLVLPPLQRLPARHRLHLVVRAFLLALDEEPLEEGEGNEDKVTRENRAIERLQGLVSGAVAGMKPHIRRRVPARA